MEAEYMALVTATQEAKWLRHLESELHKKLMDVPTVIYCDNQSAIKFAGNDSYCARSKHNNIRYHFHLEKVANKEITLSYIGTQNMVADILTKTIPHKKTDDCSTAMGLQLRRVC
ncbi:Copia protein [Eumeta japonica]|uniref:Copia protein n=1 Tax=Eumeta variegata TaxID=151549 RepID=A0A4C1V6V5_EUMVA|nr:Copia protein [Eumeta japonica]